MATRNLTPEQALKQADAFVESTSYDDVHPDIAGLMAGYKYRRDGGDERGAYVFARSLLKRAARAGLDVGDPVAELTVAELKDEIARRNEGRAEDEQIRPEGSKKADLQAALAADDARE